MAILYNITIITVLRILISNFEEKNAVCTHNGQNLMIVTDTRNTTKIN